MGKWQKLDTKNRKTLDFSAILVYNNPEVNFYMNKIDFSTQVEVAYEADITVVGGGLAGASAAIAAAREGKKVLLIESSGCLGGMATNGHVSPLDATRDRNGHPFGGIGREIIEEMRKAQVQYGYAESTDKRFGPHLLKWVLLRLAVESGVNMLFHATLLDATVENDEIRYILVSTKSGIQAVKSKVFIDATGDADLVARSGEEFILGTESNADEILKSTGYNQMHYETPDKKLDNYENKKVTCAVQPCSIMFTMCDVDMSKDPLQWNNKLLKFGDLPVTKEEFQKLPYAGTTGFEENGDLIPLPQGRILFFRTGRPNEVQVNMSRIVGVNVTDAVELSDAEVKAQLQVMYLVDFLKRFVPGFENSRLLESGNTLGIREARRLVGKYVLRGTDAIYCVRFDDDVACGSYMIDIHDPFGKRKAIGGDLQGSCYGIPYRSLVPKTIKNLLVCGRCISSDHVAHASTRIQGTCCMTGQAAGTAATISVSSGKAVGDIDVKALIALLETNGVDLIKKKAE